MEAESASLRELFRTGRYADLRAELTDVPGGVRLDFVVRQNFYINRVQIEGLREPPSEALALVRAAAEPGRHIPGKRHEGGAGPAPPDARG